MRKCAPCKLLRLDFKLESGHMLFPFYRQNLLNLNVGVSESSNVTLHADMLQMGIECVSAACQDLGFQVFDKLQVRTCCVQVSP